MINGWEQSKGAKIEYDKASELGMEILYENLI